MGKNPLAEVMAKEKTCAHIARSEKHAGEWVKHAVLRLEKAKRLAAKDVTSKHGGTQKLKNAEKSLVDAKKKKAKMALKELKCKEEEKQAKERYQKSQEKERKVKATEKVT